MKSKAYRAGHLLRSILCAVLAAVTLAAASASVYADAALDATIANDDRINEWEAQVLQTAAGRLEYEGHIYYAYEEYLDELISYFTKADLDLSEKDAKDAIAQIKDPQNARAGARSGYLYQIGGKPKESDGLVNNGEYDGKVYAEFDPEVRYRSESEYMKSDLYLNNKEYIEERSGTVYESQAAMRKEMKELAAADKEYRKLLGSRPADADITELTAPAGAGIGILAAAIVMILLTIAILVISIRSGTISLFLGMDDESWNLSTSRKQRHKIRKTAAVILAVILAINIAIMFSGIAFHSTAGSDRFVETSIDSAGVCQHNYMEFRDNVHEFLSKRSIPQNSLDLAMTYRDFKFDYIKGVRSALRKGDSVAAYRGIEEAVDAQIELMAYITKQDAGKVTDGVNDLYEDSMSTSIGTFLYNLRQSVRGTYTIGFIIAIVCALLAAFILVFERRDIYRGIRDLSFGILGGSLLWGILTAVVHFVIDVDSMGFADDAVYAVASCAAAGALPTMLTLLASGLVAGLLLLATAMLMRRNHDR